MGQNGKYQTDRYVRMAHHFTNTGETAPSFFLREANKGTKGKKESMFLVSDGNRTNRRKLIEQVAGEDRVIKVLLAAIDFEWTLRRTVMALGYSPTKQLAEKMSKREFRHFDGIKKLWKDEVVGHLGKGTPTLAQVIDTTAKMPTDARGNASACLQKAREFRNNIVHGNQGSCGKEYGELQADVFFAVSDALAAFAMKHKKDIFKAIRRTKPAAKNQ